MYRSATQPFVWICSYNPIDCGNARGTVARQSSLICIRAKERTKKQADEWASCNYRAIQPRSRAAEIFRKCTIRIYVPKVVRAVCACMREEIFQACFLRLTTHGLVSSQHRKQARWVSLAERSAGTVVINQFFKAVISEVIITRLERGRAPWHNSTTLHVKSKTRTLAVLVHAGRSERLRARETIPRAAQRALRSARNKCRCLYAAGH